MLAVAFAIPFFILIAIFVLAVIRLIKGRKYSAGEGLQLIGQVPANPSLPGTAFMFPGRGTPPDPDVRKTAAVRVDVRPKAPLPDGIRAPGDTPARD
jgi:hypothetical protein